MPREIISIHVGGTGSLVGLDTVNRMCLEHGIHSDGTQLYFAARYPDGVFFNEQPSGKRFHRSMFVDLEPKIVDEIRSGSYRALFRPECLVSGMGKPAGNNFAIGKNFGNDIIERLMEVSVRKLAEECDMLQGFNIYNASGGGIGAGLTSLVCENLGKRFRKQSVLNFSIDSNYSSPDQAVNHALGLYYMQEDVDVSIPLGVNAMKKLCQSQLRLKKPTDADTTRLMATVACATTESLRFPNSQVNQDLKEFTTNLVPYRSLKFILSSYGPLVPVNTVYRAKFDPISIANSLFTNTSVVCNAVNGSVMGATMHYRGDFRPDEVNRGRTSTRRRINFIDFVPTGFKVGHTRQSPVACPGDNFKTFSRSGHMLSNNTAISELFARCADKFDKATDGLANSTKMRRYTGEGIELDELREASESLDQLLKNYKEAVVTEDEEEEEEEEEYGRSRL